MTFFEARRQFEIDYFKALMAQHREMSNVARAAGLNRPHCYRLLQRIGLRPAPTKATNVRQLRCSFDEFKERRAA